jgi:hypothetical protein
MKALLIVCAVAGAVVLATALQGFAAESAPATKPAAAAEQKKAPVPASGISTAPASKASGSAAKEQAPASAPAAGAGSK